MATAGKTPLDCFRRRQKRRGVVRVEVHVRTEDAALVRGIAETLGDPGRTAEARGLSKARFALPRPTGLKDLLASSPLDGIDLERSRDPGRPVNP